MALVPPVPTPANLTDYVTTRVSLQTPWVCGECAPGERAQLQLPELATAQPNTIEWLGAQLWNRSTRPLICWLTGYDKVGLQQQIEQGNDLVTFFALAPSLNPNSALIKGVVCGVRVEDVDDPLMQKIRYLDKLVDELAKGKAMDKVLRA